MGEGFEPDDPAAELIESVKRLGGEARGRANSAKGKLSDRLSERKARRSEEDE